MNNRTGKVTLVQKDETEHDNRDTEKEIEAKKQALDELKAKRVIDKT